MARSQSRSFALVAAGLAAFVLSLTGGAPTTALAPPPPVGSSGTVDYVNLGDSYSAGFGSGMLEAGPLPGCLQGSGPTHVTKIAALSSVELTMDAACAGLTTTQIAGVVSEISPYLATAELTTLTLGGNDLDLRGLVLACSTMGTDAACDRAVGMTAALLPSVSASAHRTLQLLDQATSGDILVLGYPRLFTASAGDQPLMSAEHARELNKLSDALNRAIRTATRGTDATFVSVMGRFDNHGLGATDSWIYFNLANLNDPFNLHPTTEGYLEGYYPAARHHIHLRQLAR